MNKLFSIGLVTFLLFFNYSFSQVNFIENSDALGMSLSYGVSSLGGGVSFIDFDDDGWDDISFTTQDTEELYF